jgi:hypothetical protein
MITTTVINCVIATNQTYVDSLKASGSFDAEAQKIVSDSIITGDFLKLSKYQLDAVQRHLISLSNQVKNNNPKVRPQRLLCKSGSFSFMKPDLHELVNDSFEIKQIREIFFKEIRQ